MQVRQVRIESDVGNDKLLRCVFDEAHVPCHHLLEYYAALAADYHRFLRRRRRENNTAYNYAIRRGRALEYYQSDRNGRHYDDPNSDNFGFTRSVAIICPVRCRVVKPKSGLHFSWLYQRGAISD